MDLLAEMLPLTLRAKYPDLVHATRIRPPMVYRLGRLCHSGAKGPSRADLFLNRFWDYPKTLRAIKNEHDLFHIVDQSYGQLVHFLPPNRTVVTCHDLDVFGCFLDPTRDRRSILFKLMMRRVLDGFCNAARVVCVSAATRNEILSHGLIPSDRLTVIHNGVHPSCTLSPEPSSDSETVRLLGPSHPEICDILHVGSAIPRKRIDVLLEIVAAIRTQIPRARLVRVGGKFTSAQAEMLRRLNLGDSTIVLPFIDRSVLAAVYRRAALVLLPSEREGFGLPVIEAMACGTPVVASNIPALREVGGVAALYCPVGDVSAWSKAIVELLCERTEQPEKWAKRRAAGIAQASKFTWAEHARKMVTIYKEVLASAS